MARKPQLPDIAKRSKPEADPPQPPIDTAMTSEKRSAKKPARLEPLTLTSETIPVESPISSVSLDPATVPQTGTA
jgi:hypothetical protein